MSDGVSLMDEDAEISRGDFTDDADKKPRREDTASPQVTEQSNTAEEKQRQ